MAQTHQLISDAVQSKVLRECGLASTAGPVPSHGVGYGRLMLTPIARPRRQRQKLDTISGCGGSTFGAGR